MQIVVFSIGISIFIRWVMGWISSFPNANDVNAALTWASLLMVVIAVLHVILGGAFSTLISSAQVFSGSVQSVFSGGGPNVIGGLGGAITGGLTGALVGGPAGALAGALSSGAQGTAETGSSLASMVTTGVLSAVGLRAAGGLLPGAQQHSPVRGDVFRASQVGTPGEALPVPRTVSSRSQSPAYGLDEGGPIEQDEHNEQGQQPKTNLWMPGPAEAEASLQALAGREGWQDEQVEMIKAASRRSDPERETLNNLALAPGFERSTPETIQRALRAAQAITPDPTLTQTGLGTRPLAGPGTEPA
jgi:hypothetical protein